MKILRKTTIVVATPLTMLLPKATNVSRLLGRLILVQPPLVVRTTKRSTKPTTRRVTIPAFPLSSGQL